MITDWLAAAISHYAVPFGRLMTTLGGHFLPLFCRLKWLGRARKGMEALGRRRWKGRLEEPEVLGKT